LVTAGSPTLEFSFQVLLVDRKNVEPFARQSGEEICTVKASDLGGLFL
jgi:hypothetical protein